MVPRFRLSYFIGLAPVGVQMQLLVASLLTVPSLSGGALACEAIST